MSTAAVGDVQEQVVVDDLRRTQIIQYAGASGDFNPLHTDEVFAVETAGRRTVLSHGMLTMGLAGRVLTDWFGPAALRTFGVRFVAPVWPGDTLRTVARIESVADLDGRPVADVQLTTRNADDAVILTGTASVWLTHPSCPRAAQADADDDEKESIDG